MLATFFIMLVIFQCIKSVTNILNLSPTHFVFNIRPQHRVTFEFRYLDPNRVNLVRCNKDDYHHVSCLQKRNCLRNQNQAIVRPASNNLYHINNSIRAAKTNLERFHFRWLKFRGIDFAFLISMKLFFNHLK